MAADHRPTGLRRRVVLLGSLAVAIAVLVLHLRAREGGLLGLLSPAPEPTPSGKWRALGDYLTRVPPSEMPAAVRAAYRLGPDRRCLLAFADVRAWLVPGVTAPVDASFHDGRWQVSIEGEPVAALSELPDFDECTEALRQSARALVRRGVAEVPQRSRTAPGETATGDDALGGAASSGAARSGAGAVRGRGVSADAVLADLRELDRRTGGPTLDPAVLDRASFGAALVVAQMLDAMEIGDPVAARAWAMLALAAEFSPRDPARAATLLAWALDYPTSARRHAGALPADDVVRCAVREDEDCLVRASRLLPDDELAQTLMAIRLGRRHEYARWLAWTQEHFAERPLDAAVLQSGLALNAFVVNRTFGPLLPYLVLTHVFRETADVDWLEAARLLEVYSGTPDAIAAIAAAVARRLDVPQAALVRRFDEVLAASSRRYPGPIVDASIYRAYQEALFYSALQRTALFALDQLSSTEAAERLTESFAGSTSPRAVAFVRWYGHLVEQKKGAGSQAALLDDLRPAGPDGFGGAPRRRTFDAIGGMIPSGKPQRAIALRAIVPALDSRPSHAAWLAGEASASLYDVGLAEALADHVVATAATTHPGIAVWHAGLEADPLALERQLRAPWLSEWGKIDAVQRLAGLYGRRDPHVDALYGELLRESPDSFQVATEVADHYGDTRRYPEARRVLASWLARRVPDAGLERVRAQTGIARTYYLEGSYEDAWRAVAPVIESQQNGAMLRGAKTLVRLGRKREAEALFARAIDRYPGSLGGRLDFAEMLWGDRRHEDAAAVLASLPGGTSQEQWIEEVAKVFAETFGDRGDREVLDAFAALQRARIPADRLRYLPKRFAQKGRHELAFAMLANLRDPSLNQVEILVEAYRSLVPLRGRAEAVAWLRDAIPPQIRNPASMVLLKLGEDDLLWEVVEQPEAGTSPEWVWLVRAISAVRQPAIAPERRKALLAYFSEPRPDDTQVLANYLLGHASEDEVLRRATDDRRRAEAAYFIGLKQQCAGRTREAAEWYRVVFEIGIENIGEYHWATTQLYWWKDAGRSLDLLPVGCGDGSDEAA